MKTKEKQGYGVTGITVEISFLELIAIEKMANILRQYEEEIASEESFISNEMMKVAKLLKKTSSFMSKITQLDLEGKLSEAHNDLFGSDDECLPEDDESMLPRSTEELEMGRVVMSGEETAAALNKICSADRKVLEARKIKQVGHIDLDSQS